MIKLLERLPFLQDMQPGTVASDEFLGLIQYSVAHLWHRHEHENLDLLLRRMRDNDLLHMLKINNFLRDLVLYGHGCYKCFAFSFVKVIMQNDHDTDLQEINQRSWVIVESTDLWFNHERRMDAISTLLTLTNSPLYHPDIFIWITNFVELMHAEPYHAYLKSVVASLCNLGNGHLWNFDRISGETWVNDLMPLKSVKDAKDKWQLTLSIV